MVILQIYQRQLEVAREKFGDILSEAKILYTFPKHFHQEREYAVKESYISDSPLFAIEEFLEFVRSVLITK